MAGTLYIVGTPIGNLSDMTFRAVETLKKVDVIAAEDTRGTIKLLNHFEIHTGMVAYHKYNEREASEKLIAMLDAGKNIALVTDAGMPVISDPGEILVAACHDAGIPVRVVPGPTAALSAVALSGLDCHHFTFLGFLGKKQKAITEGLGAIKQSKIPVVLYESPHRLTKILDQMAALFPERSMRISREITKKYEETLCGTVAELAEHFHTTPPKGEFVLIVDGDKHADADANDGKQELLAGSLEAHVAHYEACGMTEKQAMKAAASDRGIPKREVYAALKIKK